MEITPINAFFDLCIVSDRNETFEGLETDVSRGLVVLFDSSKMSASKAEQLSEKLFGILVDSGSMRINALDFVSTYAGKNRPCVPVSVAKAHTIQQYQDLATQTLMQINDEAFSDGKAVIQK